MTRSSGFILLVALRALDCGHDASGRGQHHTQRELARAENAERRALAHDQTRERGAAREEAREEHRRRTANVQEQSDERIEASRDRTATIALACRGVEAVDACPIPNGALLSSADTENGVTIAFSSEGASRDEVQRRIDCYQARATLRGAPDPSDCIVDLADQSARAEVGGTEGHVVVTLSSPDGDWVSRVRSETRELLANVRSLRASGSARN